MLVSLAPATLLIWTFIAILFSLLLLSHWPLLIVAIVIAGIAVYQHRKENAHGPMASSSACPDGVRSQDTGVQGSGGTVKRGELGAGR